MPSGRPAAVVVTHRLCGSMGCYPCPLGSGPSTRSSGSCGAFRPAVQQLWFPGRSELVVSTRPFEVSGSFPLAVRKW